MSLLKSVPSIVSVKEFIKDKVHRNGKFEDDPFIVIDLSKIHQRLDGWLNHFPDIEPFFALKAQHHPQTVKFLVDNSCGFDVASLSELESVIEAGCDAQKKVLYAQPYKQASHLKYALEHGVLSVCDNVDEIVKISEMATILNCLKPKILLRILPDEKEGQCFSLTLSSKFGASLESLSELAQAAKSGNVEIVGICFHVGSHCHSSTPYWKTLKLSRLWWDKLTEEFGFPLEILDIGGGFPGEKNSKFTTMAREINDSIACIYGDIRDKIRIIAEPGRYLVTSSGTVVANIIAVKGKNEFVLNTGVYGGLSSAIWDKKAARNSEPFVVQPRKGMNKGPGEKEVQPVPQQNGHDDYGASDGLDPTMDKLSGGIVSEKREVVLWGPTCDSSDKLVEGYCLEGKVERGDWIAFPDLGAYCTNIMTNFNGFPFPSLHFVRSEVN